MLRITTYLEGERIVFELAGRLAGAWVDQLRSCWEQIAADRRPVDVMLQDVTFIDTAGKGLLADMYRDGVQLLASGCMTKAIIEQIKRGEVP
jgi:anti-anti-sigma regulatory factor